MPELLEVAGQRVLNLSSKDLDTTFEAFENNTLASNGDRLVVTLEGREVVSRGVFSDREMKVALEIGHIVCDPYASVINGSSIDVTLGHYFYHAGSPEQAGGLFNPFSEEDTHRYFGIKNPETDYKEAKPWGEVKAKLGKKAIDKFYDLDFIPGIPAEHPMILLRPGERILAHTHEFIGILPPGTTAMQARSTMGRIGLSACYCAGWGDPGYINRLCILFHPDEP